MKVVGLPVRTTMGSQHPPPNVTIEAEIWEGESAGDFNFQNLVVHTDWP